MLRNKKGVTIIELGVVAAFIALMVYLLSPFVQIIRKEIHRVRCAYNLEKISLGLREYAIENNDSMPSALGMIYSQGYIQDEKIFDCPFSQHVGIASDPDYIYVDKFSFNIAENPVIVYDKRENHVDGTMNVLYLNGEIVSRKSI